MDANMAELYRRLLDNHTILGLFVYAGALASVFYHHGLEI